MKHLLGLSYYLSVLRFLKNNKLPNIANNVAVVASFVFVELSL
ncbi:hypothetical protein ACM3BO_01615 [Mammaliicoccus sciuri]